MAYQARAVRPYPYQRRHVVVLPNDAMWCSLGQSHLLPSVPFSGTWTAANTALGFWITAPYDCTVYQIGWINGSAAGGDTDVAIYDSDGTTRLVSTGATTGTGNNLWQFVDTTDLALAEGKDYFVALNHSATTANQIWVSANNVANANLLLTSMKTQSVGATALPDPFVPADPASGNKALPLVGLMLTSLGTS